MGKDRKGQDAGLQHYTAQLQVISSHMKHVTPSVLLVFDKQRYLFNAGEGLQRLFREYKISTQKIDQYLLTRVSTDSMSGLAGMLLCRADKSAGGLLEDVASCTIRGPPGVGKYVNAFRTYAGEFSAKVEEFGGDAPADALCASLPPIASSGVVTITPLLLRPAASTPSSALQGASDGEAAVEAVEGEPPSKRARLAEDKPAPPSQAAAQVVCYICQLGDRSGKFDAQKAAALGVPNGPLRGQLVKGQSVVLPGGRVVLPNDVMDPPAYPGPTIIMLDCPSPAYLPALQQADLVAKYKPADSSGDTAAQPPRRVVLVHLSPAEVLAHEGYKQWSESWGASCTQLLICDPRATPSVVHFKSSTQLAMLNSLHPSLFPLPIPLNGRPFLSPAAPSDVPAAQVDAPVAPSDVAAAAAADGMESAAPGSAAGTAADGQETGTSAPAAAAPQPSTGPILATNLTRFRLMPPHQSGIDTADVKPAWDPVAGRADLLAKGMDVRAAAEAAAATAAAQLASAPEVVRTASREELEIVFLGTASSQPGTYRNVSGTYVDLFARGGLMVDCGEDCLGQMCRKYGQEELERRVAGLRLVWISHMHADHHGGLYHLLALRSRILGPSAAPLLICGPHHMWRALNLYRSVVPMCCELLPNDFFTQQAGGRTPPEHVTTLLQEVKTALGLKVLHSFPVDHVKHSYGLTLEGEAGWKVVFSGDTQPCPQVVAAATGATLLVHEATFDDSLVEEARNKKHSTVGEAIQTAQQAGAYCTILTHFSQRYPRVPVVEAVVSARAAVAFDLMAANLADLPALPALVEPLDRMFVALAGGDKDGDGADQPMGEAAAK